MDTLIAGIRNAARAAAQARDRISTHQSAGTAPDSLDREILDAWLIAATALAVLICRWPHSDLKAQAAQLHHLADHISQTTAETTSRP